MFDSDAKLPHALDHLPHRIGLGTPTHRFREFHDAVHADPFSAEEAWHAPVAGAGAAREAADRAVSAGPGLRAQR